MSTPLRYYAFVLVSEEIGWKNFSSKTGIAFWPTLGELVNTIKWHKELMAKFPNVIPRYKIYRETPDEFICEL